MLIAVINMVLICNCWPKKVIPFISGKHVFTSMIAVYGHTFIINLGIGNTTTFVYPFIIDKYNKNRLVILQLFIIYVLGICLDMGSMPT